MVNKDVYTTHVRRTAIISHSEMIHQRVKQQTVTYSLSTKSVDVHNARVKSPHTWQTHNSNQRHTTQPHDSVTRLSHTTQSHNSITRLSHTTQSHDSITRLNHTTQSHDSTTWLSHTTQSHDSITRLSHTTQSHDSVTRLNHTTQSHDSVTRLNHTTQSHSQHDVTKPASWPKMVDTQHGADSPRHQTTMSAIWYSYHAFAQIPVHVTPQCNAQESINNN